MPVVETIALNLIAGGLSRVSDVGVKKTQKILRNKRFSEDLDELETEFTTALKEALSAVNTRTDREVLLDVQANWKNIVEELDDIEIVFENEREAIVRITNAIGEGLDIDLDSDPVLREALEASVAESYQTALREFANRIAGTDLAAIFDTEADIELTSAVNKIDDQLTSVQSQLRRRQAAALRNAGFKQLDPLYFERHKPGDPEVAWRTGFGFAEVQAEYPLVRNYSRNNDTDELRPFTDVLLSRLDNGEELVVLGDGGSGKSTICKQVACQWHTSDTRGPVFYRAGAAPTAFDEPGTLIEAVRAAEKDILIVVEDAASDDVTAIYEVLDEFKHASDVSFLLDSRKTTWRNADNLAGATSFKCQRQRLQTVEIPDLDVQECQRAVDHYESLTGNKVGRDGEQLYETLQTADIGGPLILAYELTGVPAETGSSQTISALHDDVHRAHQSIDEWTADNLSQTVAIMINILNAADLPVSEALIHTLADDRNDHRMIDRTLGFLEGKMLESASESVQTPHQMWSALYLEQHLDVAGERLACDRFERCVDALFRFCETDQYREQVTDWLRYQPDVVEAMTENPVDESGRFVRQIADIGQARGKLGILYGTPETWRVSLPQPCPSDAIVSWYDRRGRHHLRRGDLDAAESEWDHLKDVLDSLSVDLNATKKRWRALALGGLGVVARMRGNIDAAYEYHEKSLDFKRQVGDDHGEAVSLKNLGVVVRMRGDLDAAKEYLEKSLPIFRDVDDRHNQATSLTYLGEVICLQGDLDAAEEYHKKSLSIFRKIGERHRQATCLDNLGKVARKRGNLDAAEEYHQNSLAIEQEMSDRHGQAKSLNNLGIVGRKRSNLDDAEELHKEALAIFREVGDLHGQAKALRNLGEVARMHGDLKNAKKFNKDAFEKATDGNALSIALTGLENLVNICKQLGASEEAVSWCDKAIDLADKIGDDEKKDHLQDCQSTLIDG